MKEFLIGDILHLTLKKIWFDEIASGKKVEEYREIKCYWTTRLVEHVSNPELHYLRPDWKDDYEIEFKHFDRIVFKNGYSREAPVMVVECKGIEVGQSHTGEWCYVIRLGDIFYNSKNNS